MSIAVRESGSRTPRHPGVPPVSLDTGARYHGYCSDITRTCFVSPPPADLVEIYKLELAVSRRVLEAIRAGVTLSDPDETAHRIAEEAGYG